MTLVRPISFFGAGYCAEYQAVYDALTTPPSAGIATAQNTMCCALIDAGIWAKLDLFYLFAQTTNGASEALVNWLNPGTFDATLSAAFTFTALEGFTCDVPGRYINTNWNPSTNGVNFVQNDASFGIYVRNDNPAVLKYICGVNDGTSFSHMLIKHADGKAWISINAAAGVNVANADAKGFYIVNRLDASDQDLFRNKVKVIDASTASNGVPNEKFYVLAANNNGAPTNSATLYQASVFFAGGGLSQGKVDIFTDAIEAYMTSNGKDVIP